MAPVHDGKTGGLSLLPAREGQAPVSFWPSSREAALAAIAAVTLTWLEIKFSRRLGLLAYPPFSDGVSYLIEAKRLFYRGGGSSPPARLS